MGVGKNRPLTVKDREKKKALVGYDDESTFLARAVWNAEHFDSRPVQNNHYNEEVSPTNVKRALRYVSPTYCKDTNLTIPKTIDEYIYDPEKGIDTVWDVMRYEAQQEAQREPLLVSLVNVPGEIEAYKRSTKR